MYTVKEIILMNEGKYGAIDVFKPATDEKKDGGFASEDITALYFADDMATLELFINLNSEVLAWELMDEFWYDRTFFKGINRIKGFWPENGKPILCILING